jgi:hypothetical protein
MVEMKTILTPVATAKKGRVVAFAGGRATPALEMEASKLHLNTFGVRTSTCRYKLRPYFILAIKTHED